MYNKIAWVWRIVWSLVRKWINLSMSQWQYFWIVTVQTRMHYLKQMSFERTILDYSLVCQWLSSTVLAGVYYRNQTVFFMLLLYSDHATLICNWVSVNENKTVFVKENHANSCCTSTMSSVYWQINFMLH